MTVVRPSQNLQTKYIRCNMTELVNKIKTRLESGGFKCDVEDTHWSKTFTHMVGGGTISINGQVMQQQGTPVEIEMLFEILYEACVKDTETGKEETSLMCWFRVKQGDDITQDLEINLYKDDYDFFNRLVTQIFGI